MRKKTDRVHQLLRFTTDRLKSMVDSLSAFNFLSYFIYDPVASGSLISPKIYEKFCLPYTKEVVHHMRKYTDSIGLHVCGDTTKSLELLVQTGVDAVSLDQKVDLAIAKENIGNQVCLMGNVDPIEIFMQGNFDTIEQAVRLCYEKAYNSPKGFIFRSGCGLPYETLNKNVQAYIKAARSMGG